MRHLNELEKFTKFKLNREIEKKTAKCSFQRSLHGFFLVCMFVNVGEKLTEESKD